MEGDVDFGVCCLMFEFKYDRWMLEGFKNV